MSAVPGPGTESGVEPRVALGRSWTVILAGVGAALHLAKLIPALPVLQQVLGLSLVQAGFLLSTVQVAGMSLGLVIGLVAQRLGLRRSLLVGLVVLGLASLAGGFTQGVGMLLLLRAMEGVGFLLVVTPAPGLLRRFLPPQAAGHMLGVWGAYMPLGTALALLFGPVWMAAWGWSSLWWGLALLSAAQALWVAYALPVDPGVSALQQKPSLRHFLSEFAQQAKVTLGQIGPWLLGWCFAVYSGQWLAVMGFLPSIYSQAQLRPEAIAMLTALVAAVNMVGNIAAGRLLSRGAAPAILLRWGYGVMGGCAVLAFSEVAGAVAQPAGDVLRYLAVLGFSAVGGLIPGTLFYLSVRLAPTEATVSTTVGWMQQWSAIGQFGGPPLVAWVAVQAGGWQCTWVVTGLCAATGMVLSVFVQRAWLRKTQ